MDDDIRVRLSRHGHEFQAVRASFESARARLREVIVEALRAGVPQKDINSRNVRRLGDGSARRRRHEPDDQHQLIDGGRSSTSEVEHRPPRTHFCDDHIM